ncbi:MAG: HAMP domain-containing histidine kinase [Calditrichaceae bacterium]|nr:HAMP domain-containing histidine kinase [Calditrichaceae bacterium]
MIFLLGLDSLINIYYPSYKTDQDIGTEKKSIEKYLIYISELIAEKNETDILTNDQVISYLIYNPDITYIVIPDSGKPVVHPANLFTEDQIKSLRCNEINELNGRNVLTLEIIPALKYNYEFNLIYIGINADDILEKKEEYFKTVFIIIISSVIVFLMIVFFYLIDLYKFITKLNSKHATFDNSVIKQNKMIHNDGINQLKSRLLHRKRELKSINNILAATIKSQRNFIKVISHDLKAPLRNVSGLVDSIFRKYPDKLNEDVANRLSRIKKNVDKEREMISDILRNITNQKGILKYEKVDINEIISSIFEDLDFDIQEKHIEINIQSKLPFVYSNRIILKHVFQNLLDNACKYFPEVGKNQIEITCIETNSDYTFSVKDTGPGIPKEVQKTLFHSYDLNQATGLVEDMDSGLGLELVSTFMEIINGKIWLESEIGEGTTFFISLTKLDDTKAGIFE